MVVFPLLTATKKIMKKKNSNYKNYNHNKQGNCNGNNQKPMIEIAVGQRTVLDFAPSVVNKSLRKIVKLCYLLDQEHCEHTDPIDFRHIDFDLRNGERNSSMILSFENENRFLWEMVAKIVPILTRKDLYGEPFFMVETYNEAGLVSTYSVFPESIGYVGCNLVVEYGTSSIMTTEKNN